MLEWLVYNEDFNSKKIREFNIFSHGRFFEDCRKNVKKHKDDKEAFVEQLRRDLMYYFWSKCEYEIILTSLFTRDDFHDRKIDVYDQVFQHWNVFSDWVWEHRDEFDGRKKKVLSAGGGSQYA